MLFFLCFGTREKAGSIINQIVKPEVLAFGENLRVHVEFEVIVEGEGLKKDFGSTEKIQLRKLDLKRLICLLRVSQLLSGSGRI